MHFCDLISTTIAVLIYFVIVRFPIKVVTVVFYEFYVRDFTQTLDMGHLN